MDPLFFILVLAFFITKQAGRDAVDAIAVAKGKPAPSLEKWKQRHPGGTPGTGVGGYFGRVLSNGLHAASEAADRRHARKQDLFKAKEPKKSADWVKNKLDKAEARKQRREKWTQARRRIWDKWAGGTPAPIIERPGAPRDGNPDQIKGPADPTKPKTCPEVVPLSGMGTGTVCGASLAPGSDRCPLHTKKGEAPTPTAPEGVVEPQPGRSPWAVGEKPDLPTPDLIGMPNPLVPSPPTPAGGTPDDAPSPNPEETIMTVPTTTAAPQPAPTTEIVSRQQGLAYTAAMQKWASDTHAYIEPMSADMQRMVQIIEGHMRGAEQALASVQAHGFTGTIPAQFQAATERLALMRTALTQANQALAALPDSAQAVTGAYGLAHRAFQEQSGIEEQSQILKGQGNLADHSDFYTKQG